MYAEKKSWKVEIMSSNETDIGGFKEVILNISGKGAYSRLKYESGVHRVQRVPTTEAGEGFTLLPLQWQFCLKSRKLM